MRTIADIQRLRDLRASKSKDLTLSSAIDQALRDVKSAARAHSAVDASILRNLPQRLQPLILSSRFARATLTLDVADAAALFELERWFKAGGEKHLLNSKVRRIKLQLAHINPHNKT
jgi:hypothetical protein